MKKIKETHSMEEMHQLLVVSAVKPTPENQQAYEEYRKGYDKEHGLWYWFKFFLANNWRSLLALCIALFALIRTI